MRSERSGADSTDTSEVPSSQGAGFVDSGSLGVYPLGMAAPPVIGLCGGIGAGKSTVARGFEALGARVLDADRIAHEVLDLPEVRETLSRKFGTEILTPDGRVDRAVLKTRVFGDAPDRVADRRFLESVVHPEVRDRIVAAVADALAAAVPPPAIVLDVPLLLEGPLDALCTRRVFIEVPDPERFRRTARTRGWTEAEHRAREAAQMPLDAKRARCDAVITNVEDPTALAARCRELLADFS